MSLKSRIATLEIRFPPSPADLVSDTELDRWIDLLDRDILTPEEQDQLARYNETFTDSLDPAWKSKLLQMTDAELDAEIASDLAVIRDLLGNAP